VPTDGTPYPVFAYTALLPWTFFAVSITFGITSLTSNLNLVTKIYFPREILPLASIGAAFVDLLVGAIVFIGLVLYYGIPIRVTLWILPILLVIQILLTTGIVLFSSAVNVFYHDIQYVVPLAIQLLMYATPVIYPASQVPLKWRGIYMLNPMAVIIESYRAVLLRGIWPEWQSLIVAGTISCVVGVAGYLFFKKVEWEFADII
jgi:lipopolysaccharide transport system permease protein